MRRGMNNWTIVLPNTDKKKIKSFFLADLDKYSLLWWRWYRVPHPSIFFLSFCHFFFFSFCIWCLSGPTFTTLPTLLIYSRDPLAPSLGFSCPASSNFHRLAIIVCIRLPSHSSWLAIFGLSTFALCPWGPIKGSSGYICGQGTRTRVLRQADIAPPGSSKVLVNNEKWSECRSTSLHSIFLKKWLY